MLAIIVIIAGLIIGWAFSWGITVGIFWLLNMAGVAIEFNIYVATGIWLIMALLRSVFSSKNGD